MDTEFPFDQGKRSPISKEHGRMEDLFFQVAGQFKVSLGYRSSR